MNAALLRLANAVDNALNNSVFENGYPVDLDPEQEAIDILDCDADVEELGYSLWPDHPTEPIAYVTECVKDWLSRHPNVPRG